MVIKSNTKRFLLLLAVIIYSFSGCKQVVEPEDPFNDAQIVPSYGIGGIRFGMNADEVKRKYGTTFSNAYTGYAGNGWIGMHFADPDILIFFLERKDSPNLGPVDIIEIGVNFTGKTKEGFGMGSPKEDIPASWGLPEYTNKSGHLEYVRYNFNGIQHGLGFSNNKLYYFRMGSYFIRN